MRKIVVYGRENTSGTYDVLPATTCLKLAKTTQNSMQSMPGTAAVVNAVSKDKFGIGYGGCAYGKEIKLSCQGQKRRGTHRSCSPARKPSRMVPIPLTRYLYMYLDAAARPARLKDYIDWIPEPRRSGTSWSRSATSP